MLIIISIDTILAQREDVKLIFWLLKKNLLINIIFI